MRKGEPEDILDIQRKHLDTYQSNVDRIESDAGTERQDKAGYEGRFVFELLQNAADEMDATEEPRVTIELTDERLIVANNGKPFTIQDLYAITLTTRTTKAGKTTIGHKGRGFTSVLNITDQPRVFSEAVQAKFDRDDTCRLLNEDSTVDESLDAPLAPTEVPMLQIPFPAEASRKVRAYLEAGFTTVFEFPLDNPDQTRPDIARRLRNLSANTVALLPELRRIDLETPSWGRTWYIDRDRLAIDGEPTLVTLSDEPHDAGASTASDYLLFERSKIDRDKVAAKSDLDQSQIDSMGPLSVKLAFEAYRTDGSDSRSPEGWMIAPVSGSSIDQPPYVHVFLPTQEHSPIPALVSGTFQSDTSRRNLPLDYDDANGYSGDFNALLFDEVGTLLETSVLPFARASSTTPRNVLACLDPSLDGERDYSFNEGSVEHCLFEAIKSNLRDVEFLPANSTKDHLTVSEALVPYTSSETAGLGRRFADIVGPTRIDSGDGGASLVDQSLLDHRSVVILRALGAESLGPADTPQVLETVPTESILFEYASTRISSSDSADERPDRCVLFFDPVLVLLVEIRKTLDSDDEREMFDDACCLAAVFPTETTVRREGLIASKRRSDGEGPFFFPPENRTNSGTLPGLQFLPRELYHGNDPTAAAALRESELPADFRSELDNIWSTAEFSFARIFDAAINPHIPGPASLDADSSPLESSETLETIKTMADLGSPENDRTADRPLLYRTSRGRFFELCRLPIPAYRLDDDSIDWVPAHRVYFSESWLTGNEPAGSDRPHIEALLRAVSEHADPDHFQPWFLAPPPWFGIEGDDDETVDQWSAFFQWLGVAKHVRPLPFFSPDRGTRHRYKRTEGINRAPRSAISSPASLAATDDDAVPVDHRYTGLDESMWVEYRSHLLDHIEPIVEEEDHRYLFQVNPLEYASEILSAAERDREIGEMVLCHLAEWWDDGLYRHRHAAAANFSNKRWRSSNLNYVFKSNEIEAVGVNLWLWQIRNLSWVPTTMEGQERAKPTEAWMLPERARHRFSLKLDRRRPLLPYIEVEGSADRCGPLLEQAPGLFDALDVGTSLERSTFGPTDAERALRRIATLLAASDADYSAYAGEVELLYSRLAGLFPALARDNTIDDAEWRETLSDRADIEVLCTISGRYEFRPAAETFFVRSESARDRYSDLGLPILVLTKPESPGFGIHIGASDAREEVVSTPVVGDTLTYPIEIDDVKLSQDWFETITTALLVRLRIDRAVDEDTDATSRFLDRLYPVDSLVIELSTDVDEAMFQSDEQERPYHIDRVGDSERIVYIDATLAGSAFVDALAQAYTEYVGVPQYYEAAYNLIDRAFGLDAPTMVLGERLDTVGGAEGAEQIAELKDRLFGEGESRVIVNPEDLGGDLAEPSERSDQGKSRLTAPVSPTDDTALKPGPRSARIPTIDSITMIGDRRILRPKGERGGRAERQSGDGSSGGPPTSSVQPASQEYRKIIDDFGMEIVKMSERSRLEAEGETNLTDKVWDVSTPEAYEDAKAEEVVQAAIGNSPAPDVFDTDWPGFDVLSICTNERDEPMISRCIELKTSGRKTRKPSLSWNEWKAASTELAEHYYLYVVRNIRKGQSGEADLLEIPQPFHTLTKHKRERTEREVQLDLRSFDFDDEPLTQQTIEWEE